LDGGGRQLAGKRAEEAARCVGGCGSGGGKRVEGEAPVPFVPCGEARFQNTELNPATRWIATGWREGINLARFLTLHTVPRLTAFSRRRDAETGYFSVVGRRLGYGVILFWLITSRF
jgi:hypothetical protein